MATLFRSPIRFVAAHLLRALMPVVVQAAPAGPALMVDGRVRVVGGGIENASMVVERDGSIVSVHTTGLDRFELPLDLQCIYLLTFQHPGCIEKQLLLDTHVPDELLALAPFTFPFKVTLEPRTDHSTLRYAGPVGLVRFHTAARDFDYDRDYTMVRDGLELVRKEDPVLEAGARPASTPELASIATVDATVAVALVEGQALPVVEPMAARTVAAPIPVRTTPVPLAVRTSYNAPVVKPASPVPTPSASDTNVPPRPAPAAVRVPARPAVETPAVHRAARPAATAPVLAPPAPLPPDGRSTELLIEELRVTTIVRVTTAGRLTEYRRVASRYGAVYYFKNGISCSEITYTMVSCER